MILKIQKFVWKWIGPILVLSAVPAQMYGNSREALAKAATEAEYQAYLRLNQSVSSGGDLNQMLSSCTARQERVVCTLDPDNRIKVSYFEDEDLEDEYQTWYWTLDGPDLVFEERRSD